MIDESAHTVFDYGMKDWHDFRTHKCSHCSRQLDIYYCESRLYLVRCKHCKIVSLVEAGNPNEAAEKVSHCAQQPNEPLTLEKLRKMDGEPVWYQTIPAGTYGSRRTICYGEDLKTYLTPQILLSSGYYEQSNYGKTWLAYRRPPKAGETK